MEREKITAAAAWQWAKELAKKDGWDATPERIARSLQARNNQMSMEKVVLETRNHSNLDRLTEFNGSVCCAGSTSQHRAAYINELKAYYHGLFLAVAKATKEARRLMADIEHEAEEEKAKITAVGMDADLIYSAIDSLAARQKADLRRPMAETIRATAERYKLTTADPRNTEAGRRYILAALCANYDANSVQPLGRHFIPVELPSLSSVELRDIEAAALAECDQSEEEEA